MQLISEIRSASRELVRQLGLMNRTVAGTDLSVSAVHAIIEIGQADGLSSKKLSELLLLEKSTVSRLVKSLLDNNELCEVRLKSDARQKNLYLTDKGRDTLRRINEFAESQVFSAMEPLDNEIQQEILNGLKNYAAALTTATRTNSPATKSENKDTRIEFGYRPTIIGRIIEMMHSHMNRYYGFSVAFEARIASDIAEFMTRISSPKNETWHAAINGRIVGSISIDGEDLEEGLAHLRWFVVDENVRGAGTGEALLRKAVEFCDNSGFSECHLWTVKGLDAARKLYERHGFELVDEYYGDQWGDNVLEQKFVRQIAS